MAVRARIFPCRSTCAAFGVPGTLLHANDVYRRHKEDAGEALTFFGSIRSMFGAHFFTQVSCCRAFRRPYRGRVPHNAKYGAALTPARPEPKQASFRRALLRNDAPECALSRKRRALADTEAQTRASVTAKLRALYLRASISQTYARRVIRTSLVNWRLRRGHETREWEMPQCLVCRGCRVRFVWSLDQL